MGMRAQNAQLFQRLDKVDAIIVMLFNPRCHRKNIGIENDVFGREPNADQQVISTLADFDLALFGVRLPSLVERHHHDSSAIGHAQPRVMQKGFFAFFHRNRIHDGLARNAFQPRLNDAPFGTVDHQRHARNIWLGSDPFDECRHRLMRVEQTFIHIDVDNLRAIFDLVARDFDSGFIIAGQNELLELGAAGDVCTFTDVDEAGGGGCHIDVQL